MRRGNHAAAVQTLPAINVGHVYVFVQSPCRCLTTTLVCAQIISLRDVHTQCHEIGSVVSECRFILSCTDIYKNEQKYKTEQKGFFAFQKFLLYNLFIIMKK